VESIKGTISKVIFSKEDTGYRVLSVLTPSGKHCIVVGEFGPEVVPETVVTFHGDYKTHDKYGHQFRAKSYTIDTKSEELASIKLFLDNIAPNIGPERAAAIIAHFGNDIIHILNDEPHRLTEVEGIGKVSAESLSKAWQENRSLWDKDRETYSLRSFLISLGIKERRIKKVLATFGGGLSAEELIRENPYVLTKVDGFGFTTVDYIAKQLGIAESSIERFTAFIDYLLNIICPSSGHLYLDKGDIVKSSNKYCRENGTTFLGKESVELSDLNNPLTHLVAEKRLIDDNGSIYSVNNFNFESHSASRLIAIMNQKSDLLFINRESIDEFIKEFEARNRYELSEQQRTALYCFSEKKVFVLTGNPGSGKTTTLRAIVDLAIKKRLNLTCMTPTGISAKKLSQTVEYDAYTIHRRLGFRGNEWTFNELDQYDTDVAIIDETSMVDMEVFYRMVTALTIRTHLVFVGDQDQLPSVGAGNVLKELINSEVIPVIRLDKIFRQAEASDIIKAAHGIKNGSTNLDLFKPDPKADVFFLRMTDPKEIEKVVVKLAEKFKEERRLFQIITPRNDGPLGVDPLNQTLQAALNPQSPVLKEINCLNHIIREGDRIIVRKNDYENEIYNGDIGKVTGIAHGTVTINIDGRSIQLNLEEVDEKIRLAYSITVHRSQGQEYPYIILPFINQFGKMMLQRNLLYTAITRAKEKVIIIGHGSAIEKAINNASVSKRNTKFGERLKSCSLQKKNDFLSQSPLPPNSSPDVKPKKEPSSSKEDESYLTDLINELSRPVRGKFHRFMTSSLDPETSTYLEQPFSVQDSQE